MRWVAPVLVLAACSFHPGSVPSEAGGGDANGDGTIDGPMGPPPTSPRKLTFGNGFSTTDLTDFPVLVVLDPTRVDYAAVSDPKTDLRFEDPGGKPDLPFEVETWNPNGTSYVWVLVPQIDQASDTDYILMHFGASAAGTSDPAGLWSGYDLVSHFSSTYANSVGGNYTPIPHGVSLLTSLIGTGVAFISGIDSRVTFSQSGALFSGWSAFTLEMWIYADYPTPLASNLGEPRTIEKSPSSLNLGRLLRTNTSTFHMQIDMAFEDQTQYVQVEVPPRTWTYLAYAYDGSTLDAYADGTRDNRYFESQPLNTDSTSLVLGNGNNAALTGIIDEVRVSQNGQRGADWFHAQDLSMRGTYVTFGAP